MSSYRDAGVDIDKANALIGNLKEEISKTYNKYVISGVGGFGALLNIDLSEFREPVVSVSTDGVGTKLLLAKEYDMIDGIGIDLVAMNVDDVVCTGAKPVAFLDYYACGRLDDAIYGRVIRSIVRGCQISGIALVGGETAEMPGMYKDDDFDLSGVAIGVAEKSNILPKNIKQGDKLIALASSGFHSNGYSLIRKILKDKNIQPLKDYGFSKPLIELLLEPTRIYSNVVYPLIVKRIVKGLSHITGGGIIENTLRVTQGRDIKIYKEKLRVPEFMNFVIREGNISEDEAFRVFNMGVGMIIITDNEDKVLDELQSSADFDVYVVGEVL
ncbi:MAG: phosphoribosylformylglycinamidine cyclo-ligase [Brevinematales bacterium]|nr:phosphoribosylformylglycinamidine cyclo-ligase [Brevinematales bacterium]